MLAKGERIVIGLAISISAIALIAVVTLVIVDRQFTEQTQTETSEQTQTENHSHQYSKPKSLIKGADESVRTDTKSAIDSKVGVRGSQNEQKAETIQDVIRAARTWKPIFAHWNGSMAPDFTLPDIFGKQHKLSDYRGKDIIVVFWATWCGPCIREIPHLKELQDTLGRDKLVILAITNENPGSVKMFASNERINYTILLSGQDIPTPYRYIGSIPSSFFINTEGKIKLATSGLIPLEEIKAILQAK